MSDLEPTYILPLGRNCEVITESLTIRQQAALMMAQGLLANTAIMYSTPDNLLAESAVRIAGAVLKREQETRG